MVFASCKETGRYETSAGLVADREVFPRMVVGAEKDRAWRLPGILLEDRQRRVQGLLGGFPNERRASWSY